MHATATDITRLPVERQLSGLRLGEFMTDRTAVIVPTNSVIANVYPRFKYCGRSADGK